MIPLQPLRPLGPYAFPQNASPSGVYVNYGDPVPYFLPAGAVPESVTGGGPKTYRIPSWATMNDVQRVRFIRSVIDAYGQHPHIRKIAFDILTQAGVPERDYVGQGRALLAWVQQNIRYANEKGEIIQDPIYTINTKVADCDDMAVVFCALAESIHLPTRLVISGTDPRTKKTVRWIEGIGFPQPGVKWAHIYAMVGNNPFKPTGFAFVEPTLKVPFGWDVVQARDGKVPMPELGAAGDALERKKWHEDLDWKDVRDSVIKGAVTALVLQGFSKVWKK